MAVDGGWGPRGGPRYLDGGAPDLAVDSNELSKHIEDVGNRKVGTTAERNAALTDSGSRPQVWEGLEWYDTTTRKTYVLRNGSWTREVSGVAFAAVTNANGVIVVTHDLGQIPAWGQVTLRLRTLGSTADETVLLAAQGVLQDPTFQNATTAQVRIKNTATASWLGNNPVAGYLTVGI